MTSADSLLRLITDRQTHDAATGLAEKDPMILVVIYVTDPANPRCVQTTPKIESLAKKYVHDKPKSQASGSDRQPEVLFYNMELTPKTAPMIKFGIQNTPIFIGYRDDWCQTMLGGDVNALDRLLEEQVEVMNKKAGLPN